MPPSLDDVMAEIAKLPPSEQAKFADELEKFHNVREYELGREHFMSFVALIWPDFIGGPHHKIMAEALQRVCDGTCKRLIINLPPRHTKSEFCSWLLVAWFIGLFPNKKVIQASHTVTLAEDFGRKVRDTVNDNPQFHNVFPGVVVKQDSSAAGKWETEQGGKYFAIGVDGKVAGRGADLLLIDDPHSEQEAKLGKPEVFDSVYEWYQSGPRQRLQPGAAIVVIMTRWHKRDLTGRLIKESIAKYGRNIWEVIRLPAKLPSGNYLWTNYWSVKEYQDLETELDARYWQAQYQQNPISEEGAILKRGWWRDWTEDKPPKVSYILLTLDTAFSKAETADFSAFTLWGVFDHPDPKGIIRPNLILLDAFKDRLNFPALRRRAKSYYKEKQPDMFIIENKGSGQSLAQELAMAIPGLSTFNVTRGTKKMPNDKIARANSIATILEDGLVWRTSHKWAEEVVTECGEFPSGEHDDYVDCVIMALYRFRQGGFLTLGDDERDEDDGQVDEDREYYAA